MGDGIYGAEAASNIYFHKKAKDLSKPEASLIAAVLPNPRKFSVTNPGGFVSSRKDWILNQMALWGGVLSYEKAEEKEVPSKKKK
jgi:monofunctional biosynthetic peptidoglycan transglycosylase